MLIVTNKPIMVSVIMLSVVMLIVVMLSVIAPTKYPKFKGSNWPVAAKKVSPPPSPILVGHYLAAEFMSAHSNFESNFLEIYAECHNAECQYAVCQYAECHYAECHILLIIVLIVAILNIIVLSVVMLNVVAPFNRHFQPSLVFGSIEGVW